MSPPFLVQGFQERHNPHKSWKGPSIAPVEETEDQLQRWGPGPPGQQPMRPEEISGIPLGFSLREGESEQGLEAGR